MVSSLLDWLPVVSFFIAFKVNGIYFATKVLIAASLIQILAIKYLLKRKLDATNLSMFALILVMGGLTLFFHNEAFIKWKPTILYLAFALAFLITPLIKRASLAELMLASKISITKQAWKSVNFSFIAFFIIMAALNTIVFLNYSTEVWVNYKLFGTLIITLIFMVGISCYLIKHKD